MTNANDHHQPSQSSPLVRKTLRMTALLVVACVLFVGALSVVAVTVTSRAVGVRAANAAATPPTEAKKPLSI